MSTIVIELPEDLAAQLEAQHISEEKLESFLVEVVRVWLVRQTAIEEASRPWSKCFQGSAIPFIDQLIEENRDLFEELARL